MTHQLAPGWRSFPPPPDLAVFGHVTAATGGGGGILEKTGALIGSMFLALLAARLLSRHPLTGNRGGSRAS
jgi:hypothetical protein